MVLGNGHEKIQEVAADSNRPIVCRGVRGATTVESNTAEDILEVTGELLTALIALNDLRAADLVSAIFTTTPDLDAIFPAVAARDPRIGWTEVPLLCSHEMAVPGSLRKAVRILLHVNTRRNADEIKHVYLRGACQLRPEWAYSEDQLAAVLASAELGVPSS